MDATATRPVGPTDHYSRAVDAPTHAVSVLRHIDWWIDWKTGRIRAGEDYELADTLEPPHGQPQAGHAAPAVIDLFAGPGGWDVAGEALGLEPLGVEWDDAACATREAAGLWTLQADIGALEPGEVLREHFGVAPLWGLIASPPCQAFSMAGKGEGRKAIGAYRDAIGRWVEGKSFDRAELDEQCGDERAHLVLEPLRWAFALRPQWIACEQVEPVLPLWEAMAAALRRTGYKTWTGVLSAEQYGVPQTRKRAILLASLDGPVGKPEPTHQRYIAPRRREEATLGLFDAPEPERIVSPEDRDLLPWVSMAESLGWGTGDVAHYTSSTKGGTRDGLRRPAAVPSRTIDSTAHRTVRITDVPWSPDEVGFSRRNDRPGDDAEYRERDLRTADQSAFALTEKTRSWIRFRSNDRANATERAADEPAPTITGGHDFNDRQWVVDSDVPPDAVPTHLQAGTNEHDTARAVDEPANTLRFGARLNTVSWVVETNNYSAKVRDPDGGRSKAGSEPFTRDIDAPSPSVTSGTKSWTVREDVPTHMNTGRDWKPGVTREDAQKIPTDQPAPTVSAKLPTQAHWVSERPSTTVTGTQRSEEGGTLRTPNADRADASRAVRVTLAEALVLQSFPPDYPVQGTKTKQFEQVGNAVPPLLALHALAGAIGLTIAPAPAGEGTSSGLSVEYRRGGERLTESTSADAPAPTVTTRTDRWQVKPEQAA